jgi:hypothetical protein
MRYYALASFLTVPSGETPDESGCELTILVDEIIEQQECSCRSRNEVYGTLRHAEDSSEQQLDG